MDREKVIKGLKNAIRYLEDKEWSDEKASEHIDALIDVHALLKEQEWIPVTERLPKSMVNKVLVYVQHEDYNGFIGYGHYEKYKDIDGWFDLEHPGEQFSERGYYVTHWMETPEKPEKGR